MYKIAVSVICYDNEEEVLDFADKLSRQKDSEKIVLLVTCNKCMNVKKLINDLNEIKISSQIFEPGKNLGYLHGCLHGFKEFGEEYEWAVISNTDIDFVWRIKRRDLGMQRNENLYKIWKAEYDN